jgi:hypothetical protein
MHPFIHPQEQNINRPQHNHHYIKTSEIHSYPTRYSEKQSLYIPNTYQYSKTYLPKHTIHYSTKKYSHIWNTLPCNITSITNITQFKKTLAIYLQKNQNNES